MTVPLVELDEVSVQFGTTVALQPTSMKIHAGKAMSIAGRSGSGKSTLLSVLALLRRPSGGSVFVNGVDARFQSDVDQARTRAETVGIVFQSFHLEPTLTVLENVMLPWRFGRQQVPYRAARARSRELLGDLQIADLWARRPHQLSGGQRQRAAIARALLSAPKLLLADEPTGNLDEDTANGVARVLTTLPNTHGTSVIVVTHDMALAESFPVRGRLTQGTLTFPLCEPAPA